MTEKTFTLDDIRAALVEEIQKGRDLHLNFLASAIVASTGCKPEELELVQQQTADAVTFHFRRRSAPRRVNLSDKPLRRRKK